MSEFAEGFYWGQCKLECYSYLNTDIGKTVRVTDGFRVWEKIFDEGLSVVFILPGTNKYTVSISVTGTDESEYEESILLGYGEYKLLQVSGYSKDTFIGVQSILNSHKETELLNIGDEYPVILSDNVEMVYQIGGINIYDEHDVIFVPKWLYPTVMPMKISGSGNKSTGGFNATTLRTWLVDTYFYLLPEDVRNYIVETKQVTSAGDGNFLIPQNNVGKIILPTEWEVIGAFNQASPVEHNTSLSLQWPIFAVAENRIKSLGKNGNSTQYWTCSPTYRNVSQGSLPEYFFIGINMMGGVNQLQLNENYGVLPCFRMAAEEL